MRYPIYVKTGVHRWGADSVHHSCIEGGPQFVNNTVTKEGYQPLKLGLSQLRPRNVIVKALRVGIKSKDPPLFLIKQNPSTVLGGRDML